MSKKLLRGYASFIMEQGDFHNLFHLEKKDANMQRWIASFTEELLNAKTFCPFKKCC
jgi:hypothetical protein